MRAEEVDVGAGCRKEQRKAEEKNSGWNPPGHLWMEDHQYWPEIDRRMTN